MPLDLLKNKKSFLMVVSSFLILLFIIIIVLINWVQSSSVNHFESFKKISLDNRWSTESEYSGCQDKAKKDYCIFLALKTIRAGINNDLITINSDVKFFDSEFSTIETLIEDKKYSDALVKITDLVAKDKELLSKYQTDFKQINNNIKTKTDIEFATTKRKIIEDWAIYWIKATEIETDDALVISKKVDGIWSVVYGPGTDYSKEVLTELSIPLNIINYATGVTPLENNETE